MNEEEKQFLNACEKGDYGYVSDVLNHNKSFANLKDEYGDSALIKAIHSEKKNIVKLLIENGADVNARSNTGGTALIAATGAYNEDIEIVTLLINAGANVNVKMFGLGTVFTPLKYAKAKNHFATVQILISAGAIE